MAEADIPADEPLSKNIPGDLSYEEQLALVESMMTCYDTPLTQGAGYTRELLKTIIQLQASNALKDSETLIELLAKLADDAPLDAAYAKNDFFTGAELAIRRQIAQRAFELFKQREISGIDAELIAKGRFQKQVVSAQRDVLAWPQWLKDRLQDGEPKRESGWISTKNRLPVKPGKASYEHVDCLVVYKGEVEQLMWNCEHLVWDDRSGDDFYCKPQEVDYWMPTPHPPEIEDQS